MDTINIHCWTFKTSCSRRLCSLCAYSYVSIVFSDAYLILFAIVNMDTAQTYIFAQLVVSILSRCLWWYI